MRDIYPYVPRLFDNFNSKDEARFSIIKHIIKGGNWYKKVLKGESFNWVEGQCSSQGCNLNK